MIGTWASPLQMFMKFFILYKSIYKIYLESLLWRIVWYEQ